MVPVPAGEFTMGSDEGDDDEQPVHRVVLDSFYLDTFEVTNGRFAKFVAAIQSEPPGASRTGDACGRRGAAGPLGGLVGGEAARDEAGSPAGDEIKHPGARDPADHLGGNVAGNRLLHMRPTETAGLRWQSEIWPMA